MAHYFKLNNCEIISKPESADCIIFVTCAFIKSKEEECFRTINILNRYKGELIIAGCLPAIAETKFKQIFKGKFVVTKNLYEIDQYFEKFKVKFSCIPDAHFIHNQFYIYEQPFFMHAPLIAQYLIWYNIFLKYILMKFEFPRHLYNNRWLLNMYDKMIKIKRNIEHVFCRKPIYDRICHLRVGYGCLGNCTYCSIRNAIGSLKSKPIDLCLEEYEQLLYKGCRYFIIIADDVGAYGLDIGSSFSELLSQLSTVDRNLNVKWIIHYIDPKWLISYKLELLGRIKEGKIISILCAIESGSDRILYLMNRYNNTKKIVETLLEFKEVNPNLILSTNVIIGFPSETEDDFFATLDLIKKINFNYVRLFSYHNNENAPSFKLDNKLDNKTIEKRLKIATNVLDKEGIAYVCDWNAPLQLTLFK